MFIGHYGISTAARAADRTVRLWVYVAAAQLLDLAWCVLIMLGVEKVGPAPATAEGLEFISYPWSHSLVAAIGWGIIGAALVRALFKTSGRSALLVGLVVFSHWPIDLLVHHQDLPLWPGDSPKYGFALWDYPWLERGAEVVVLLIGCGLWAMSRAKQKRATWPAWVFAVICLVLFYAAIKMPMPAVIDPVQVGEMGLGVILGVTLVAWLLDRGKQAG
jgi:hypothetical protein